MNLSHELQAKVYINKIAQSGEGGGQNLCYNLIKSESKKVNLTLEREKYGGSSLCEI